MFGIEKKETVFQKKDKAAWNQAKSVLKDAGITKIRSGSYENEAPACGCGAKIDVRDFGPKGKIDRAMYYIDVPVSQAEKAREILNGLT